MRIARACLRLLIAGAVVWLGAATAAWPSPPDTDAQQRPGPAQSPDDVVELIEEADDPLLVPPEPSETPAAAGLKWLAAHQNADGSWRFDQPADSDTAYANPGTWRSRTGATGLALLGFLAAGQTHKDGEYTKEVRKGLTFLLKQAKKGNDTLDLRGEGDEMIWHGVAAFALCEAFAMTRDRGLQVSAQQAINFVVEMQDKRTGAWAPNPGQKPTMTVFFWQLSVLKSGRTAYLRIPEATVKRARRFLDAVQADGGAKYGETGPDDVTPRSTVAGLLCRDWLGTRRRELEPHFRKAVQHGDSPHDCLQNYVAHLVMRSVIANTVVGHDDPLRQAWNKAREKLFARQVTRGPEAGSWFRREDVDAATGGRLYQTALNLRILLTYPIRTPIYRPRESEEDFPL